MNKPRFILCALGVLLGVCIFMSCAGDANSAFNTKYTAAYIKAIDLHVERQNPTPFQVGGQNVPVKLVNYAFDKGVLEYMASLEGEPDTLTFTVEPDVDGIAMVYLCKRLGINDRIDLAEVDFDIPEVTNITPSQVYTIPLADEQDDYYLAFMTKPRNENDRGIRYGIRIRNSHKDTSVKDLIPWHIDSNIRMRYASFSERYAPKTTHYAMTFYPNEMSVRITPNNQKSVITVSTNGLLANFSDRTEYLSYPNSKFVDIRIPDPTTVDIVFTITSEDEEEHSTYTIDYERLLYTFTGEKWAFTRERYKEPGDPSADLVGGIDTLKNKIFSASGSHATGSPLVYTPAADEEIRIRGVVTGDRVRVRGLATTPGPGANTSTKEGAFFIEDSQQGILCAFEENTLRWDPIPFNIGDIIEIKIRRGVYYYSQAVAIIDDNEMPTPLGRVTKFQYMPVTTTGLTGPTSDPVRRSMDAKMLRLKAAAGGAMYSGSAYDQYLITGAPYAPPSSTSNDPTTTLLRVHNWKEGNEWFLGFLDGFEHVQYGMPYYNYGAVNICIFSEGQVFYPEQDPEPGPS